MSNNANLARAKQGKGDGLGRKGDRAKAANDKIIAQALGEGIDPESMRWAVVLKAYGYGWFGLKLSDGRETKGQIRELLSSKKGCGISDGSIVLVHLWDWEKEGATEKATGVKVKPKVHIEGVIVDRKDVTYLKRNGAIPEWMTVTQEEAAALASNSAAAAVGYEFEAAEDDDSEESKELEDGGTSRAAAWAGRKNMVIRTAAEDIDVDDI
jgi:translation initiation factor IF-1